MSPVNGRVQLPLKSGLPFGNRGAGAFMSTFVTFALWAVRAAGERTIPGSTSAVTIKLNRRAMQASFPALCSARVNGVLPDRMSLHAKVVRVAFARNRLERQRFPFGELCFFDAAEFQAD